jgi:L-serine/L-threonine ammonia-lyase
MAASSDLLVNLDCTDFRFSDSISPAPARERHVARDASSRPTFQNSSVSKSPQPLHIVTPLIDTEIRGRKVSLKLDNLQPARSFKLRGIGRLCQHHAQRGATRFVCSSAGNAGFAVAWVGRALAIPVTVVVPECTPAFVRQRIHALGADVRAIGTVWDQANAAALQLAKEPGVAFIPPFDHPLIWQGHASLIDELAQQCPQVPDAILLAVGGGGLLLGVLEGLRRVGWLDTRVFAVEPENAAALGPSLASGEIVQLSQPRSVATSLCVQRVAPALLTACRDHAVTALTVTDEQATAACVRMAEDYGQLIEPACGAALAPLYGALPALADAQNIVAIVCGGMVVTLDQLAKWGRSTDDTEFSR